jgi:tRNA(Ile)-lysidine synthase
VIGAPEFAELMARLGPWRADRAIAVAVSGGADSLCLAVLAARWGKPFALVVDHGLRQDSAAEADLTTSRLAAIGIPSRKLPLRGLAPGPGLAARARAARYAALTEAAKASGHIDILLGHHAADQAETVKLRHQAGSGQAGLAGMAAIAFSSQSRLVRPLLGLPPARLRATLRAAGLAWVDDPSNTDPSSARARVREALGRAPDRHAALLAEASGAGQARQEAEARIAGILADRVTIHPEGFAILSPGAIDAQAFAALQRGLTGAPYAARTASLGRLAADPQPGVVAGLRILPAGRLGPGWLLVREASAMAAGVPATPGAIWDRRFTLAATQVPNGLSLGALGDDAARLRRHAPHPACVMQTLPALRLNGRLAAVPSIGYCEIAETAGISVVFSPANPVCGAPFRQ